MVVTSRSGTDASDAPCAAGIQRRYRSHLHLCGSSAGTARTSIYGAWPGLRRGGHAAEEQGWGRARARAHAMSGSYPRRWGAAGHGVSGRLRDKWEIQCRMTDEAPARQRCSLDIRPVSWLCLRGQRLEDIVFLVGVCGFCRKPFFFLCREE